jgi:hypothetical protein
MPIEPWLGISRTRIAKPVICLHVLAAVVVGCASPATRYNERAAGYGFERLVIQGDHFRHVLFIHNHTLDGPLHIYFESDGTPWRNGHLPARDPTPLRPVALELMALDNGPAMLVGRPCYHGLVDDPGCDVGLWTDARYGEMVVRSLETAIRRWTGDTRPVVLIGFSGGGALAMLVAPRLPCTEAVVTLAGNLDIDAWTAWHKYRPLEGSINPVSVAAQTNAIPQLHLAGENDRNIPPQLLHDALNQHGRAPVVLSGVTHAHGWERYWSWTLTQIAGQGIQAAAHSPARSPKVMTCSLR